MVLFSPFASTVIVEVPFGSVVTASYGTVKVSADSYKEILIFAVIPARMFLSASSIVTLIV